MKKIYKITIGEMNIFQNHLGVNIEDNCCRFSVSVGEFLEYRKIGDLLEVR